MIAALYCRKECARPPDSAGSLSFLRRCGSHSCCARSAGCRRALLALRSVQPRVACGASAESL